MDLVAATIETLLREVRTAATAAERSSLVRAAAARLDKSERTIYRLLADQGWTSGRKPRSDRGRSAVGVDDLTEVAAWMARARNKRGEPNLPLTEAHRIAAEQATTAGGLSRRQLARRMSEEGLSLTHMRAQAPAIARVSSHPNHVGLIDISVGIQWYFRDATTGKKLDLYDDAGARFYEGKRQNLATINRVIHRYRYVDHYTGASAIQYFYSPGERAEDVVQFLWTVFSDKGDLARAWPQRGLPRVLVCDQGSAFKAGIVVELLKALGIRQEFHAPRNPKASGAVEKAHDTWQRSFEGRLALRPAEDLDELNARALPFCALLNAERPHARHGRTPISLWAGITPEQLREPPDRDTFFRLATTRPETGKLDNRLWLHADSKKWLVRGEGVYTGQAVTWRLAPFTEAGIRVWDGDGRELAATRLSFDAAGFAANGLRHVWDDEAAPGATAPAPPAARVAAAVAAEPVRLDTMFDDLDERLRRHAVLSPAGTAWRAPDPQAAAEPPMGSLEAREEIARRLGRPLGDDGAWWRERIGSGVTAAQLDTLWQEFLAREAQDSPAMLAGAK